MSKPAFVNFTFVELNQQERKSSVNKTIVLNNERICQENLFRLNKILYILQILELEDGSLEEKWLGTIFEAICLDYKSETKTVSVNPDYKLMLGDEILKLYFSLQEKYLAYNVEKQEKYEESKKEKSADVLRIKSSFDLTVSKLVDNRYKNLYDEQHYKHIQSNKPFKFEDEKYEDILKDLVEEFFVVEHLKNSTDLAYCEFSNAVTEVPLYYSLALFHIFLDVVKQMQNEKNKFLIHTIKADIDTLEKSYRTITMSCFKGDRYRHIANNVVTKFSKALKKQIDECDSDESLETASEFNFKILLPVDKKFLQTKINFIFLKIVGANMSQFIDTKKALGYLSTLLKTNPLMFVFKLVNSFHAESIYIKYFVFTTIYQLLLKFNGIPTLEVAKSLMISRLYPITKLLDKINNQFKKCEYDVEEILADYITQNI